MDIKVKYNLTQEEYEDMLDQQNGTCAICQGLEKDSNRSNLSVDHESTKHGPFIRGLLCAKCNRALGLANHSYATLTRMAAYLSSYSLETDPTDKDIRWLEQCSHSARRFSTCSKAAYYAVIIDRYGNHVSQGWNGPPPGSVHCLDGGCERAVIDSSPGSSYSNCVASHAEQAAILRSSYEQRVGGTIVVNGPPCLECSRLIIHSGLSKVVFLQDDAYAPIRAAREKLFMLNKIKWSEVDCEDLYAM